MSDIMADNQTEAVLTLLDRGEADDKTRDKVSAALLRSQTKMSAQLDEIQQNLWTLDKLEGLVDKRHVEMCAKCELKLKQKRAHWLDALLSNESLRYFLLILILVWAVIYVKTGTDGVEAVKDGVTHTLGQKK